MCSGRSISDVLLQRYHWDISITLPFSGTKYPVWRIILFLLACLTFHLFFQLSSFCLCFCIHSCHLSTHELNSYFWKTTLVFSPSKKPRSAPTYNAISISYPWQHDNLFPVNSSTLHRRYKYNVFFYVLCCGISPNKPFAGQFPVRSRYNNNNIISPRYA